ncbi:DUF998 domain-containing protein [Chloroflexota bacterium]
MIEGSALGRADVVRRIAGVSGIISQFFAIMALVLPVSTAPWFSWTQDHLSALGVEGSMRMMYNWGLILAGIFSVIFVICIGRYFLIGRLGRVALAFLILGSLALFSMGLFPRNWDFSHGASTVAFYVCITLGLVSAGVAAITASQTTWGMLTITAGVLVAALLLIPGPLAGGAITQLLACIPWALWTLALCTMLLVNPVSSEHPVLLERSR